MTGFPDWQKIVQWVGPPLAANALLVVPQSGTLTVVPPTPTSSFRSILVSIAPQVDYVWLEVENVISGGTVGSTIPTEVFVPAGTRFVATIDTWAPEVSVVVEGTAGANVEVGVWPTNLPAGCYLAELDERLFLYQTLAALNPGQEFAANLKGYFGKAIVTVVADAAQPCAVAILSINSGGVANAVPLQQAVAAGARGTFEAYLPAGQNQIIVINTGNAAAAHTVGVVGEYHSQRG